MVIKPLLLLGLAVEYCRSRRRMWSTLRPTIRCLWHSPVKRLRRSAVDFYSKNEINRSLSHPSGLRGNVRTPSIARWKARGRLYICHNWTFFAISYGWDVISGNLSKSAFLEGGGSLWAQISERKERRPPTTVGVRVAEWLPFRMVSKYPQSII